MKALYLLLGIVAFGFGIYMIFDETLMSPLGTELRIMFIALLLIYGGFRIFTAMSKKHRAGGLFRRNISGGAS